MRVVLCHYKYCLSQLKLTDNVISGLPCTAIRTPKRKTLDRHGEAVLIIGKSDQTKRYRVLFTKDGVVRTTQHVKIFKTLSENGKFVRQIDEHDEVMLGRRGPLIPSTLPSTQQMKRVRLVTHDKSLVPILDIARSQEWDQRRSRSAASVVDGKVKRLRL